MDVVHIGRIATGVVLLVSLMAVPLLGRDRASWWFRGVVAAAMVVFAAVVGAHALAWRDRSGASPAR